jgi:hypothetical protein
VNWSRAFHPDRWTLEGLSIAGITGASLVGVHFVKGVTDLRPEAVDFVIFYQGIRRWWETGVLYDPTRAVLNYNPPQFHLLLIPVATLPLVAAFVVWTILTVIAAAATVVITMEESRPDWSARERKLLFSAVLLCAGTGAVVHLGQVGWIIALIATLAWRGARHSDWRAAGLWLGCAASLKPFLLVVFFALAVRQKWRALLFATLAFGTSLGLGAAVFGAKALLDWLTLLRPGAPLVQKAYFINASLFALFARAGVPNILSAVLASSVVAVSILAVRKADEDTTWLVATACALLASPLGWVYYFPLLTGPLIAVVKAGRLPARTWALWPLFAFPAISRGLFQQNVALAVSVGSIYTWALFLLWAAVIRNVIVRPPWAATRSVP